MNTPRRLALVLLLAATLAAPAYGLGFRDPADRASAEPLRALDLAALLDGTASIGADVAAAHENLPEKCRHFQTLTANSDPCASELRCAWLSARYQVAQAWSDGSPGTLRLALRRLHGAASALGAASRTCEQSSRTAEKWAADARQAALDDARAQAAELARLESRVGGGPVLPPADAQRVAKLLAKVDARGVRALTDDELTGNSARLATAQERRSWLAQQPAIAILREALPRLWEPVGGMPSGCGEELLRPDMLTDAWRGYLVREIAPKALSCLETQLPRAARSARVKLADRGATAVAAELARAAARDNGGRRFGRSEPVVEAMRDVVTGLAPAPAPAPRAVASKKAPPKAEPKPKAAPRKRAAVSPKPAPKAEPKRRDPKPAPRPTRNADEALIALAERVAGQLPSGERLVRDARQAETIEARQRTVDAMVVALHRNICGALENLDPSDLDAVERRLTDGGALYDRGACRAVRGVDGVERLLSAAEGLRSLRAAAALRSTARLIALGELSVAEERLETIPEKFRGVTWSLLSAWRHRLAGDPVAASRALAAIDTDTIQRLRSSGDEAIARVVAHAWSAAPR
jgi:hypothetical protein